MKIAKPSTQDLVVGIIEVSINAFLLWDALRKANAGIPSKRIKSEPDQAATPTIALPGKSPDLQTDGKPDEVAHANDHVPYLAALWNIARAAAKAWMTRRAASKGAALALYTLFSLAPMLVLIVAMAGFFFGEDAVRASLVAQMSNLMGEQGGEAIQTLLAGGSHESSSFIAGIVSAVLVLISATSAFAELKDSLDELWDVPPTTTSGLWGVIRQRFLSFGLILVLALMLLGTLVVSAALAALGSIWDGGAAETSIKALLTVLSNVISFAVLTGLFATIFKFLPAVKIAWKDVMVGAVLTAALFLIGKMLIGLYVGYADIDSSYGAAGSVVVLITWIYYSSQIFFYGALFTHQYSLKIGSHAAG